MKVLSDIARHAKGGQHSVVDNKSMGNNLLFRTDPVSRGSAVGNIHFDDSRRTYVNADGTMTAWLRIDNRNMSIDQGLELGLITPEKARELLRQNPPRTEFTPLYVVFAPTRTLADMKSDIKNITNGVPQSVRDADVLAETINTNLETGVVPIFTGHSMRGMLAPAAGARHNCASIGFNRLGLGEGIRKFIDKGTGGGCKQANDAAHAECHSSFAMHGDWVSDGSGSLVAKAFVKKPYSGQRYMMENETRETDMNKRHNAYEKNIEMHFSEAVTSEQTNGGSPGVSGGSPESSSGQVQNENE
jgi:hypothetical protein